jgi:alpha-beta hydrolase superfamily lysophospholipase
MIHTEGTFEGLKGLKLYYQSWQPEQNPKAVLLILHGLAEHSGRYKNVVDYFIPRGYAIYAYDQRGHGKSQGTRCYVDRFQDLIADLNTFVSMVTKFHPGLKVFLVGHSIGATVAVTYSVQYPNAVAGLILSGSVLKPGESITPIMKIMARILSAISPHMGVSPLDSSTISRDKSVVDAYDNDPLVYRGKIPARMGAEALNIMEQYLPPRLGEIKLPLLIMHGGEDRLSNKEGSVLLYKAASSSDKTLKIYDGFYHEIYNEPDRIQVFADVETWLAQRL